MNLKKLFLIFSITLCSVQAIYADYSSSEEVIAITYVYYSQGYELDALNVALIINAKSESVLPMPLELPIDDLLDANVLVHVGADLFPGE